ncbi:MAG: hypothetical protein O6761_07780 [Thaumarchaeota archaeon]|nr:hypothetical protein [Nitrososphaerota archaeon]
MRVFVGDSGPFPFALLSDDGETIIDLTGFTVTWNFSLRDGTIPASTPITGTVTDAEAGEVEFDLPASLTVNVIKYSTKITITKGTEIKSSEAVISLDVDSLIC